jgi:predicted DsbA family dithiol-disulfide isomerase
MISICNESNREDKQMKLYKLFCIILALMLAAILSGCSTKIEARYSYNSQTDFSSLKSYAWVQEDMTTKFSTPESAKYYESTMENVLAKKGFNLNPDAPDFLIKTFNAYNYVEKYISVYGNVEFPKSMLRINFLNPSSKEVIYESAAYAIIDEKATQETKNAAIDKTVEALLIEFPPGS